MVVDSAASELAGRRGWGFPKQMGTLRWSAEGDERTLAWDERGIVLRCVPSGPSVPVVMPLRSVQQRTDGLVGIGVRVRGRSRLSRVELTVPAADPLAALAGRHRGVQLQDGALWMGTARLLPSPARSPVSGRSP